jgi:PAS domain-containing protein
MHKVVRNNSDELIGTSLWDAFPGATGSTFEREYRRAMTEQVKVDFEEFYPALGAWFEVHAYPSPVGLSVYFRDITERKQAEESLRESEKRFQSIVANTPGTVYQYLCQPDGSVEIPFVNEGCREIFEMEPEELQQNPTF